MKDTSAMGMSQEAATVAGKQSSERVGLIDYFLVECYDIDGNFKWKDTIKNLVTNEGLEYALDVAFLDGTQWGVGDWYVGLKDAGTPLGSDPAAQLPGGTMQWAEHTEYTDTNNGDSATTRPLLTLGAISGTTTKSVDNSGANVAAFQLVSPANDVYGVFVVDAQQKGSNSNATVLYGVGDFTGGAKTGLDPGDTLNVTVTLQATSG